MFSIFFLLVTFFLCVINFVVYNALAVIFGLTSTFPLLILGSVLGLMTVGFMSSIIVGKIYYNFFIRLYSYVTAVWMGFLAYVFFASSLYGILMLFMGTQQVVGRLLFVVALLIGVYGVINARNTKITHVTVALPNLNPIWKERKIVWISDVHLGQIYGVRFAEKITQKINLIKPDLVFIGGDLFDGTDAPNLEEMVSPFKNLHTTLGAFFVNGNHEEFWHTDVFMRAVRGAGIRVLEDEMVEIDGLQIVGVDYRNASTRNGFREILARLNLDQTKPSVLLKHEPKDISSAEQAGILLQISGHTHKAQIWPMRYFADLSYRGFVYGLNKCKSMHVYTSSGVGTWGPPLRIGTSSEIVVFRFEAEADA